MLLSPVRFFGIVISYELLQCISMLAVYGNLSLALSKLLNDRPVLDNASMLALSVLQLFFTEWTTLLQAWFFIKSLY